jgi:RNA polymerase sigma factor (sigma-70 family)
MDAAALPVAGRRRGARALLRAASDERLVARLRAGDDAAFEVIYDRHHRDLLAFCRHMLGSREEAEDALQLVFLSMHRHLRTDDRPVRIKPWLYAVARNRCLSVLRARREAVALDDVREPSTDGLAVADEVERRQDLKAMLADLGELPDEQRAALLLSELGGLSHDDIADVLGVRRAKVKALVFQARESLMSARTAREVDCREIREQLATLSGAALRRTTLRRHIATCPGCAAFKAEVKRQRSALALILPVVPLKHGVLAGILGGGGGGAAAGGGGVAATGAAATASGGGVLGGGLVTKALVTVAIAGGAAGGGAAAVHELGRQGAAEPTATAATHDGGSGHGTTRASEPVRAAVARSTAPGRPEPSAVAATAPAHANRTRAEGARGRGLGRERAVTGKRGAGPGARGRASAPGQLAKPAPTGGGAKANGTTQANPTPATPRRATAPGRVRSAAAPGQAKRTTAAPTVARTVPARPSKPVTAKVRPAKPHTAPVVAVEVPASKGKPAVTAP